MLKGFQICPGLVDDVPLNIIRCQQLVDQKPMLSSSVSEGWSVLFVSFISILNFLRSGVHKTLIFDFDNACTVSKSVCVMAYHDNGAALPV